jgi:hypothetical protein
MSVHAWQRDPVDVAREYEARASTPGARADAGALIMWAAWTIDSLFYLQEVVDADRVGPNFYAPHNPATKAVAHLRWAAGSSITALDLCAAAAARELGIWDGGNEVDARQLVRKRTGLPSAAVVAWPAEIVEWLDKLVADPDYSVILKARRPLTHARLLRHFTTSSPAIRVSIGASQLTTDELIVRARKFATRHVQEFLNVLEGL